MKQKNNKSNRKCKPFLVLPLIVTDGLETTFSMPVKNPGLNLFTKTWPPKSNKKKDERPLTATLEKPMILDIRLIGKIDMSKVRKEFLNISNLCRIPLVIKNKKVHRPLSLPSTEKRKSKSKKKELSEPNDCWEDDESTSVRSAVSKPRASRVKKIAQLSDSEIKCDANNNNSSSNGGSVIKACKPLRKFLTVPGAKTLSTSTNSVRSVDIVVSNKSTKLPPSTEACRSCGRKDRPERFHTHNNSSLPSKHSKVMAEHLVPPPVKSTVQKPLAIKYKSKTATKDTKKTSPIGKPTTTVQRRVRSPPPPAPASNDIPNESKTTEVSRAGSAKRTLTCYLCGREFGSASLPLHEPKCLQKWERENSNLPAHLQRKPPPKPDPSLTKEEWNKLAWESSQSTLTPCQNCGRTFYPDRLVVHQRSCKTSQINLKAALVADMDPAGPPDLPTRSPRPPATYDCYICGRQFGANSIAVHERQCLKKWTVENETLPHDMRSPPPVKKERSRIPEPIPKQLPVQDAKEKEERPTSSRKPPLFPCYICGKLFTVNSIYIHEPQCLKMWKIENEKLPPSKRRPQPLKPDIKFTRNGKIDYDATNDANWRSHLSQLVPCRSCARTFNAERVEIHERSCKGK